MAKLFGIDLKSLNPIRRRSLDEIARAIEAGSGTGIRSPVDDDALYSTVVLCIMRVLADGVAQVPFKLLKSENGGQGKAATDHPLYDLLRHEPNPWQSSFEFREQLMLHAGLTGNAYCHINRDLKGAPSELYLFKPNSVTTIKHPDYSVTHRVQTAANQFVDVPSRDMWHIKGPSWDGVLGLNATKLAREAAGLALASEQYGAKLFENGARPGGILSTDGNLTVEQREALSKAWQAQQAGVGNAHKTAILSNGLKWQSIAYNANDAQWVESRKFQIEELCRAFRVQPIMVMTQGATSYASVEQLMLAHIQNTLMPWYERIEQSARRALLTPEEKKQGYYFKLDSRALLEASTTDRLAYYNAGRTGGWLTVNEIREKEDLLRSDDPSADELTPAANLFGAQTPASSTATENQKGIDGETN